MKESMSGKVSYRKPKEPNQSRLPDGEEPTLTWDKPSVRKTKTKKRKVLKQYGDKGYRPSSGRGVGM